MSHGRRRGLRQWVLGALAACALAGALLPTWATSAPPEEEARGTLDAAVRFLQGAQNLDGGFGGRVGGASDPGFSAWAAYALAAAGINPQDQSQPDGVDVHTYLTQHTAQLQETTDFDRVALVAIASGTSPYSFGSVRPIEAMLARRLPDGSFAQQPGGTAGWINATVWSIFPLSTIATPAMEAVVDEAAEWLIDQQREDGSWGWGPNGPAEGIDTDTTGAVIQALNAAGLHETEAERRAFEFLKTVQGPDGGFQAQPNRETNSATTCWVIQGIWSAGRSPREWATAGEAPATESSDPLRFLRSLQRTDGSIGWTAANDMNSLWMTAQCGPALAGLPYPLAPVPRAVGAPKREEAPPALADQSSDASEQQLNQARERGHGGKGAERGKGVIAGGGGRGADLFSAPAPQSGGSTPHGARQVDAAAEAVPGFEPDRSEARPQAREQAPVGVGGGGGANAESGGGGGFEPGAVEGVLVADRGAPAAPGLFGAERGGESGVRVALLLAAALLAAAGLGARREGAT
jgi:prenyltransferase beta subunit